LWACLGFGELSHEEETDRETEKNDVKRLYLPIRKEEGLE